MRKSDEALIKSRTTGTARGLQRNYTYNLIFDNVREAQKLSNEIAGLTKLMKHPDIEFPRRRTKGTLGLCNHVTGHIRMFAPMGQTVGVLLHELAHLHELGWEALEDSRGFVSTGYGRVRRKRRNAHGAAFHRGHILIYKIWEQIKHKYMPVSKERPVEEFLPKPEVVKALEYFKIDPKPYIEAVVEPNWFDMGTNAFENGKKRVPANDVNLMVAFNEINKRVRDFNIKNALTLWLNGWDKANLEAPVATSPAPSIERKSRLSDADLELLRRRGRVPNGFQTVRM